jgi:thymidylate synthase
MIAHVCGYQSGEFIHTFGDAHIYNNHIEQLKLQLSRETKKLPILKINKNISNIFNFKYEDIEILNYNPHPHIKGKVAI